MRFNNNVEFTTANGQVKNLATEMDKIGTGGGTSGSIVADSTTNGNILVNGSEVQVYDENSVKNLIGLLTNLQTSSKTDLVSAINEVKQSLFNNLEVRTTDPSSPAVGRIWLRSDL